MVQAILLCCLARGHHGLHSLGDRRHTSQPCQSLTRDGGPFFMFGASALIVVGGLLVGLLMTAIGVLASLRAASVRAASQWFSVITLALFIGAPLLLQALPASMQVAIVQALQGANLTAVGIGAALVVLALDIALLAVGIVRFQRTRLILEE